MKIIWTPRISQSLSTDSMDEIKQVWAPKLKPGESPKLLPFSRSVGAEYIWRQCIQIQLYCFWWKEKVTFLLHRLHHSCSQSTWLVHALHITLTLFQLSFSSSHLLTKFRTWKKENKSFEAMEDKNVYFQIVQGWENMEDKRRFHWSLIMMGTSHLLWSWSAFLK